jgi:hypothetical protein
MDRRGKGVDVADLGRLAVSLKSFQSDSRIPRMRLVAVFVYSIASAVNIQSASAWFPDAPLADADTVLIGEVPGDRAGSNHIVGLGDVNGDGFGDWMLGAPYHSPLSENSGKVFLLLGRAGGYSPVFLLEEADGSWVGQEADDYLGEAIAGGGDVNGDGLMDFVIGHSERPEDLGGAVHLFFGRSEGWDHEAAVASSDVVLARDASMDHGRSDWSLAFPGDLDGDGLADIVALDGDAEWQENTSDVAYIVLGRTTGWELVASLADADASFWPGDPETVSWMMDSAAIGDLDADGRDDLLVRGVNPHSAHVMLSAPQQWQYGMPLSDLDASFTFLPDAVAAGDFDGDGLADLALSDSNDSFVDDYTGQVFLYLGADAAWTHDMDAEDAGASLCGEVREDRAGNSAGGMGDLDGDGIDDLVIGAYRNDESYEDAGQVYVVFGRDHGWVWHASLQEAEASFLGTEAGERVGHTLEILDDINGDGLADLAIGTSSIDDDGHIDDTNPGRIYLVLGHSRCTDVDGDGYGTPAHDTCSGGAEEDCDDGDAEVHPDAEEDCDDGIDNDCDGHVDGDDPECVYGDDDDSADDDQDDDSVPDDDSAAGNGTDCECRIGGYPSPAWTTWTLGILGLAAWQRRRSR